MTNGVRVLYAEDNALDADLTRARFEESAPGVELEVVDSGRRCLARLAEATYDVLLLDNHLPDMDGVDVLKELAERETALPVVMVTAAGDESLVVRVLRMGAWDYVSKDGDYIARLPAVLRNAVEEYRRQSGHGYAAQRQRRRILYVEHNPADVDLTLKHFAEHAAHLHVDVVDSSAHALDRLAEPDGGRFDLVLTDLRMRDVNALDLVREARRRALPVPFIVITGRGDEAPAVAALKLGAYDYIVKRDGYLIHLPYAIDNAIDRFQLAQLNRRLHRELAERQLAETRLRESEARFRALAESLEEANRELVRLAATAEAANKAKSEFLAVMSHELRTPLHAIAGYAQLLEMGLSGPVTQQQREQLGRIQRSQQHLLSVVEGVLAFTKVEVGRMTYRREEVSVREVLVGLELLIEQLAKERSVRLEIDERGCEARVRADVEKLRQVLLNLLSNAVKFTRAGGCVRLECQEADDEVTVHVYDTGVGIPAEKLEEIFQPFVQVDMGLTREQGGIGLGLAISREFARAMGGDISALSAVGQGSTFSVRLPRAGVGAARA